MSTTERNSRNIAVIPARAGSKRITKKNIKLFLGKPLIAYSIEAALNTGLFNKIIVSTDSKEIADIALMAGAEVPFLRPSELADDFSPISEVVEHALHHLESCGEYFDFACCIYATAPLISSKDIEYAFKDLEANPQFKTALAVSEFSFPIQRALHIEDDLGLKMIQRKNKLVRSQDLEKCYHDAGQFFWLRQNEKHVNPDAGYLPFIVDRRRVQDIDTEEDWNFAECMARAWQYMNEEEAQYANL